MKLYRSDGGCLVLLKGTKVLVQKLQNPTEWRESVIIKPDWVKESEYFTLIGNNVKLRCPK